MAAQFTYRAFYFPKLGPATDRDLIGLDFFAENKALAIDHAHHVERVEGLKLVIMKRISRLDFHPNGSGAFYRTPVVTWSYPVPTVVKETT